MIVKIDFPHSVLPTAINAAQLPLAHFERTGPQQTDPIICLSAPGGAAVTQARRWGSFHAGHHLAPGLLTQRRMYFERDCEFPRLFLDPVDRFKAADAIPEPHLQIARDTLEKTLFSVFSRLTVAVDTGEAGPKIVRYFDYLKQKLGHEFASRDIRCRIMPSGGVVRSAIGYVYHKVHEAMYHEQDQDARAILERIHRDTEDIPAYMIRGTGSDFDILIDCEKTDFPICQSLVENITNSTVQRYSRTRYKTTLDRIAFTVGDTKHYAEQITLSTNQGGASIDFLAFDMQEGRFVEPQTHPYIIRDLLLGYYRYLPPADPSQVKNPIRQTIRGCRALLELPFLVLCDDTRLRAELEDLEQKLENETATIRNHPDFAKVKLQFEKMMTNARQSAGHNRLYRAMPGSLDDLVRVVAKQFSELFECWTIPEFVDRFPLAGRSVHTQDLGPIPQDSLIPINEFIERHTDHGVVYHGTRTFEAGLAIMRGGLVATGGSNRYGVTPDLLRGGYSSPDRRTALFYAKTGLILELRVKQDPRIRILDLNKAMTDPVFSAYCESRRAEQLDPITELVRVYGIDAVVRDSEVVWQNIEAIDYPGDMAGLVEAFASTIENPEATTDNIVRTFAEYDRCRTFLIELGNASFFQSSQYGRLKEMARDRMTKAYHNEFGLINIYPWDFDDPRDRELFERVMAMVPRSVKELKECILAQGQMIATRYPLLQWDPLRSDHYSDALSERDWQVFDAHLLPPEFGEALTRLQTELKKRQHLEHLLALLVVEQPHPYAVALHDAQTDKQPVSLKLCVDAKGQIDIRAHPQIRALLQDCVTGELTPEDRALLEKAGTEGAYEIMAWALANHPHARDHVLNLLADVNQNSLNTVLSILVQQYPQQAHAHYTAHVEICQKAARVLIAEMHQRSGWRQACREYLATNGESIAARFAAAFPWDLTRGSADLAFINAWPMMSGCVLYDSSYCSFLQALARYRKKEFENAFSPESISLSRDWAGIIFDPDNAGVLSALRLWGLDFRSDPHVRHEPISHREDLQQQKMVYQWICKLRDSEKSKSFWQELLDCGQFVDEQLIADAGAYVRFVLSKMIETPDQFGKQTLENAIESLYAVNLRLFQTALCHPAARALTGKFSSDRVHFKAGFAAHSERDTHVVAEILTEIQTFPFSSSTANILFYFVRANREEFCGYSQGLEDFALERLSKVQDRDDPGAILHCLALLRRGYPDLYGRLKHGHDLTLLLKKLHQYLEGQLRLGTPKIAWSDLIGYPWDIHSPFDRELAKCLKPLVLEEASYFDSSAYRAVVRELLQQDPLLFLREFSEQRGLVSFHDLPVPMAITSSVTDEARVRGHSDQAGSNAWQALVMRVMDKITHADSGELDADETLVFGFLLASRYHPFLQALFAGKRDDLKKSVFDQMTQNEAIECGVVWTLLATNPQETALQAHLPCPLAIRESLSSLLKQYPTVREAILIKIRKHCPEKPDEKGHQNGPDTRIARVIANFPWDFDELAERNDIWEMAYGHDENRAQMAYASAAKEVLRGWVHQDWQRVVAVYDNERLLDLKLPHSTDKQWKAQLEALSEQYWETRNDDLPLPQEVSDLMDLYQDRPLRRIAERFLTDLLLTGIPRLQSWVLDRMIHLREGDDLQMFYRVFDFYTTDGEYDDVIPELKAILFPKVMARHPMTMVGRLWNLDQPTERAWLLQVKEQMDQFHRDVRQRFQVFLTEQFAANAKSYWDHVEYRWDIVRPGSKTCFKKGEPQVLLRYDDLQRDLAAVERFQEALARTYSYFPHEFVMLGLGALIFKSYPYVFDCTEEGIKVTINKAMQTQLQGYSDCDVLSEILHKMLRADGDTLTGSDWEMIDFYIKHLGVSFIQLALTGRQEIRDHILQQLGSLSPRTVAVVLRGMPTAWMKGTSANTFAKQAQAILYNHLKEESQEVLVVQLIDVWAAASDASDSVYLNLPFDLSRSHDRALIQRLMGQKAALDADYDRLRRQIYLQTAVDIEKQAYLIDNLVLLDDETKQVVLKVIEKRRVCVDFVPRLLEAQGLVLEQTQI